MIQWDLSLEYRLGKPINATRRISKSGKQHSRIKCHSKAFEKIQHRSYFNIIKALYEKYTVQYIQPCKTESFYPKVRNKTKLPALTSFIQNVMEHPSKEIRKGKEETCTQP